MPRGVVLLWVACALIALVAFLGRGWRAEAARAADYAEVIAYCATRNGGFNIGNEVTVLCYPTHIQ